MPSWSTPQANAEIERLADATGASLSASPAEPKAWRLGAEQARGDWLLLLDAGDVPQAHWVQAVDRHLHAGARSAGADPAARCGGRLRERGVPVCCTAAPLRAGLILPKRQGRAGRLERSPRRLDCRRERAV